MSVYRDPWPVRAARWGRRHRTAVAAVAVLLVTAVVASAVGLGLVWKEQQKTAARKREAEENYALARDLSVGGIELIVANEALYAADPARHKARKELLVAAAKAYRKHLEHQPDDPEVRRQAARVYRYAAIVHRLEREHAAAEALFRDAIGLLEGLARQFPEEPAYQIQLAETLRDRAQVQAKLGRLAEAVASLDRVIALADAALAVHPEDGWNKRVRAAGLLARASAQYVRGKYAEAGADALASAGAYEALAAEPADAHPYDPLLRAAAVNVLALAEREAGRTDKAAELHREAIKLAGPLVQAPRAGVNRADAEHFQMQFVLEQARTWARTGRRDLAEKNLGLLAGRWQQLAKAHPENPDYRESSGEAYNERGRAREAGGRADEARADFEKAREILEAEVRRSPDVPGLSGELGRAYAGLARLARAAGDRASAADWFGKALAALRSAVERAPERARDRRELEGVEADAAR